MSMIMRNVTTASNPSGTDSSTATSPQASSTVAQMATTSSISGHSKIITRNNSGIINSNDNNNHTDGRTDDLHPLTIYR